MSGTFRVTMHTDAGSLKVDPTDLLATLELVRAALVNDTDLDIEVCRG